MGDDIEKGHLPSPHDRIEFINTSPRSPRIARPIAERRGKLTIYWSWRCLTFLAQLVVSLGVLIFAILMLALQKDERNANTYLALVFAVLGLWTPAPKMKTEKPRPAGSVV